MSEFVISIDEQPDLEQAMRWMNDQSACFGRRYIQEGTDRARAWADIAQDDLISGWTNWSNRSGR